MVGIREKNLLHRCFINCILFEDKNTERLINKGLIKTDLLHRCFINSENLFDCCLIEKIKILKEDNLIEKEYPLFGGKIIRILQNKYDCENGHIYGKKML